MAAACAAASDDSIDCSEVRIVPQLDRNPPLLVFCQMPAGKIALAAMTAVLLAVSGRPDWAYVAMAIAAIGLFPRSGEFSSR